jgi:RNA polymerase sigma-70 factor (ECF subfamily)
MEMDQSSRTEAFVSLFAQNQYEIHSFVLTLVPNRADADDVMQTASIVLWRKFDQFMPGTNFVAWACQIARLEVQNFRRVKGRDRLVFDDSLLQSLGNLRLSMSDELEAHRRLLRDCITKLRLDDRELIRRCYGKKATTAKSVAIEMGKPVNTVYKALIRIRRGLYECVQRAMNAGDRS